MLRLSANHKKRPFKALVLGSSPSALTIKHYISVFSGYWSGTTSGLNERPCRSSFYRLGKLRTPVAPWRPPELARLIHRGRCRVSQIPCPGRRRLLRGSPAIRERLVVLIFHSARVPGAKNFLSRGCHEFDSLHHTKCREVDCCIFTALH